MSQIQQASWEAERLAAYNNYAWVSKTECTAKKRHATLSAAIRINLKQNSRSFEQQIRQNGTHRNLTAVYLCPHCSYYHNGGNYKPLISYRMLVVCRRPVAGGLSSSGSTPLTRRARLRWNNRIAANSDREAFDLINSSGFAKSNLPEPQTTLYWINNIVLPAEEAILWLLKQRLSIIEWFILDSKSAAPLDLNDYITL